MEIYHVALEVQNYSIFKKQNLLFQSIASPVLKMFEKLLSR